jgi:hypothetical protein
VRGHRRRAGACRHRQYWRQQAKRMVRKIINAWVKEIKEISKSVEDNVK